VVAAVVVAHTKAVGADFFDLEDAGAVARAHGAAQRRADGVEALDLVEQGTAAGAEHTGEFEVLGRGGPFVEALQLGERAPHGGGARRRRGAEVDVQQEAHEVFARDLLEVGAWDRRVLLQFDEQAQRLEPGITFAAGLPRVLEDQRIEVALGGGGIEAAAGLAVVVVVVIGAGQGRAIVGLVLVAVDAGDALDLREDLADVTVLPQTFVEQADEALAHRFPRRFAEPLSGRRVVGDGGIVDGMVRVPDREQEFAGAVEVDRRVERELVQHGADDLARPHGVGEPRADRGGVQRTSTTAGVACVVVVDLVVLVLAGGAAQRRRREQRLELRFEVFERHVVDAGLRVDVGVWPRTRGRARLGRVLQQQVLEFDLLQPPAEVGAFEVALERRGDDLAGAKPRDGDGRHPALTAHGVQAPDQQVAEASLVGGHVEFDALAALQVARGLPRAVDDEEAAQRAVEVLSGRGVGLDVDRHGAERLALAFEQEPLGEAVFGEVAAAGAARGRQTTRAEEVAAGALQFGLQSGFFGEPLGELCNRRGQAAGVVAGHRRSWFKVIQRGRVTSPAPESNLAQPARVLRPDPRRQAVRGIRGVSGTMRCSMQDPATDPSAPIELLQQLRMLTWIDLNALAILLVFFVLGLFKGLIWQVSRVGILVAGYVVAGRFGQDVARMISRPETLPDGTTTEPSEMTVYLAYVLLFLAVLIVLSLLALLLKRLAERAGLGFFDRLGGGVLGIATGACVVLAGLFVVNMFFAGSSLAQAAQSSHSMRLSQRAIDLLGLAVHDDLRAVMALERLRAPAPAEAPPDPNAADEPEQPEGAGSQGSGSPMSGSPASEERTPPQPAQGSRPGSGSPAATRTPKPPAGGTRRGGG
jgi:membrane protein required for colicin V production